MSEQKHFYRLIDLVNELKGVDWSFEYLSYNKNISMQDIENNKTNNSLRPFYKRFISSNPNLTVEFVLKYPDDDKEDEEDDDTGNPANFYRWDWQSLTENLGFPVVKKYPDLPWQYQTLNAKTIDDWEYVIDKPNFYISYNFIKYMPLKYVPDFIELQKRRLYKEDYEYFLEELSQNIHLYLQFIKTHTEIEWVFNILSEHLPITEIQKDLTLPWNYDYISINKTLTVDFVIQHSDEKWFHLSENENIDFEKIQEAGLEDLIDFVELSQSDNYKTGVNFILKNLDKLDLTRFHLNGIIKMQDILNHPELIRNYEELSRNPNLEMWYVLAYKNENWNIQSLSQNEAFKIEDIKEGIDNLFNWDFRSLSNNYNITFDFLYQYRYKDWNWTTVSLNFFNTEKMLLITNKLKKNYINRKNKIATKLLNQMIIKDLTNIIFEY